jgi:hypothetical protein
MSTTRITSLLALLLTTACPAAFVPIGLQGDTVSAIAAGRGFGANLVIAGTPDHGVFARYDSSTFMNIGDPAQAGVTAGLRGVRCLLYREDSLQLFAGTDSGLYDYHFTSGVPPAWRKVADIPSTAVTAIACQGDTLACATFREVYRRAGASAWAACSVTTDLPPMERLPTLTSVAFWYQTLNTGSMGNASQFTWEGVLQTNDGGKSWMDISTLAGQGYRLAPVYTLLSYSESWSAPLRLAAGTADGIHFMVDVDTGVWRPLETQLRGAGIVRRLDLTTRTRSTLAELFACADSGAYMLSSRSGQPSWQRITPLRSYGVCAWRQVDPTEWYVATADGVYRFDLSTAVSTSVVRPGRASTRGSTGLRYLIDGRRANAAAAGIRRVTVQAGSLHVGQ